MKNVTTTSKTLLLVSTLLYAVFLFSACEHKPPLHVLVFSNDKLGSKIYCDSFQMTSKSECFVWENGTKMKIVGDTITPYSEHKFININETTKAILYIIAGMVFIVLLFLYRFRNFKVY